MDDKELGRRLVDEKLITAAQLETAWDYQRAIGGPLLAIVGKLGFLPERRLSEFVARCENMQTVDLVGHRVDHDLMRRIPRWVIDKHVVLPLRQSGDVILLAMSDPADYQAVDEIQFLTNCMIETALAPRSQLLERITRYYEDHPEPTPDLSDDELGNRLVQQIADPTVQALARTLLASGLLDPRAWRDALEKPGS